MTLWFVVFSSSLVAAPLTLQKLQDQLSRSNPAWVAGESSVTQLSPAERRLLLGAPAPEADYFESLTPEPSAPNTRLRAELDWRNWNGINYDSPILNQGRCGSCVAFAAVTVFETQLNISWDTPFSPWAFSPQHLFACGGGACQVGWYPSSAASRLKSQGVPDEACFPYESGALGQDVACSKACSNASTRSLRIASFSTPTFLSANVDAVKRALQHGPLMTTLTVYEDFFYYKNGVYQHVTGDAQGGHAVAIIGYSDSDRAWIVKNSWGETWGDKGYAKVAWSDTSGLARQTWSFDVGTPSGFVAIHNLRDREALAGTVTLKVESTFPSTKGIEIRLLQHQQVVGLWKTDGRREVQVDTTSYADGIYELVAVATHAQGASESQPRQVYLMNGPMEGRIRITNLNGGETLSNSKVLDIEAQSTPVPFTQVIFRAKNLSTGETIVRSTPNVATQMSFNWRMKDLPSAQYELTLEGRVGNLASVTSAPIPVRVQNR